MEYVECPNCTCVAKRMPVLSYVNRTDNFYQCGSCGHVSLMPKDASAPPTPFNAGRVRPQEART